MLMNNTIKEIIKLSEEVIFELVAREKRPIELPDGEKIYRFELHVIDLIGEKEGINVNELAKYLNVTKGAVSQVISKLESRNIVVKIKTQYNRKNVNLFLTNKGKNIFEGHKNFHLKINKKIEEVFTKYNDIEICTINNIIKEIRELVIKK